MKNTPRIPTLRPSIHLMILFLCFLTHSVLWGQQRPNINDSAIFSAADQLELRNLMMAYITTPVVQQHLMPDPVIGNFHNYREEFLTWHRVYIADMEAYLLTQPGGDKFVPLPKWDPNEIIPDAFFNNLVAPGSAVAPGWVLPTITNQDPANVSFSTVFSDFCGFMPSPGRTAIDNFAQALEGRHDIVHGNIGGIMGSFQSPAAAIFWLWHAWVDDVYRQYECDCQMIDANDLYSKDSKEDVGNEANDETTGGFYRSIDIWVRNDQDVLLPNGRYSQEDNPSRHQNPEYRATSNPNYVYVKVRNRGCTTMPAGSADLRLYWSKASTGLNWPVHFNNYLFGGILHGDEITSGSPVAIPTLAPGETFVAEIPWSPPNPADFTFDNQHFCLLSRIISGLDPMTFAEGASVGANTRNNNNIAWKNLTVVDLDPFNLTAGFTAGAAGFFIRQTFDFAAPMKLKFRAPKALMPNKIKIYLGEKFTADLLQEAKLEGFEMMEDEQGVPFLMMFRDRAEIQNLLLQPEEIYALRLKFELPCKPGEPCFQYGDRLEFFVEQFFQNDFGDEFIGGNVYELRIEPNEQSVCENGPNIGVSVQDASCANASDGTIKLEIQGKAPFTIFWTDGGTGEVREGLAPGEYTVVVRDAENCIASKTIVVSDQSDLALIFDPTYTTRFCERLGAISLKVEGGVPDYSVQWSNGSKAFELKDLETGMYVATVTDGQGCQRVDSVSIIENFPIRLNTATVQGTSSAAASDGSIAVFFSGGAKPLVYNWSNGAQSNFIDGLPVGDYTVSVTDQIGCTEIARFSVEVSPPGNFDCVDEDINLGDEVIASGTYSTAQSLISSSTIDFGSTVKFLAAKSIALKAGFQAQNGSTFRAAIGECTANNLAEAAPLPQVLSARKGAAMDLQLQPNPAHATTNIQFQLPDSDYVTLEVYNGTGLLIERLLNNQLLDGGIQKIELPTAAYESGIYFVALQTAEGTLVKKLMVVK